ncbi:hypothetical protein ACWKWU_10680 [Chitinophaga lutea]
MKPYPVLFLAAALTACGGSSPEKQAADADSSYFSDRALQHTDDVTAYISNIDAQGPKVFYTLTAHDYAGTGSGPSGVVGLFSMTRRPIRVYIYPEGQATAKSVETWYYLDSLNSHVMLLREIVREKDSVRENSFYYQGLQLVNAETRAAADLSLLERASFAPYPRPTDTTSDYRLQPAVVNERAEKAIMAVKADRPDLSPAANEVRALGATHWASGNEPGWSLAVMPPTKIQFTTNYGEEKIEFPYAEAQKGDKDATEFTTTKGGRTLHVKFENKRCTDDAGIKHPMTVTVTLDGKALHGCGRPLF